MSCNNWVSYSLFPPKIVREVPLFNEHCVVNGLVTATQWLELMSLLNPTQPRLGSRPEVSTRAKLVLFVLGLGLALVGAEILLRVLWVPVVTVHTETRGDHPDYGFAPLAGIKGRFARTEYNVEFRHSAQRLRMDRLVVAEREPGVNERYLFLGDSFTYSIGTEAKDSFSGRLADLWPDVEVINAACTGYGPREELAVLDKLGGVLKPDVVVISFFWNDVEDALRTEPAYGENASGKVSRTSPPDETSDPLRLWPEQPSLPQSKWKTCYVFEFSREMTASLRRKYSGKERPNQINAPEQMEQAWLTFDAQYRLLKLRADEIGARLVVAHIPDYIIINPQSAIASVKPLNFTTSVRLSEICAKHRIEFHDTTPVFTAAFESRGGVAGAKGHPLFYETDRHLTVEGNAVMAEFLKSVLERGARKISKTNLEDGHGR